MNLANKITISRIVLTGVFVVFASLEEKIYHQACFIIAVIAATSDFFDGYIARKYNMVSDFGKLLDPLADKIFVTAGLLILVSHDKISAWIAIIILSREFAVTGLRLLAISKGRVISANFFGKIKTNVQFYYLALVGCIWAFSLEMGYLSQIGLVLGYLTIIFTVYTGFDYFIKNKDLYLD